MHNCVVSSLPSASIPTTTASTTRLLLQVPPRIKNSYGASEKCFLPEIPPNDVEHVVFVVQVFHRCAGIPIRTMVLTFRGQYCIIVQRSWPSVFGNSWMHIDSLGPFNYGVLESLGVVLTPRNIQPDKIYFRRHRRLKFTKV